MTHKFDRSNYLLAGLDDQQLRAVTTTEMPLIILAGAGSGKTTVLTKRIAYQHIKNEISADRSLVLTFTRKAAFELKERLFVLGIRSSLSVGTFHSIALAELIKYRRIHQRPDLKIVEDKAVLLKEVMESMKLPYPTLKYLVENINPTLNSIHLAKVSSQGEVIKEFLEQYNTLKLDSDLLWKIYSAYESKKQKRYLIEIDDIIPSLMNVLNRDWKSLEDFHFRFRYIFVDEFQDINTQQYALLKLALKDRDSLCAVGDANQSIYQFNGSDPDLIFKLIGEKKANVVYLTNNYRSNSQIASNSLKFLNKFVKDKISSTAQWDTLTNCTHVLHTADDIDEMYTVSALIKSKHIQGIDYSEIAVLARTNNQIDILRQFLAKKNIPLNHKSTAFNLKLFVSKNVNQYDSASPVKSLIVDIDELVGDENLNKEILEKLKAVNELAKMALATDQNMNYGEFLKWSKIEVLQHLKSENGVTLGTFHSVKGLEFDTVILIGVEDTLVPFYRSSQIKRQTKNGTSDPLKEEINLFYVAITRAKSELFITWAKNRMVNSKLEKRKISPFLKDFNATDNSDIPNDALENIKQLKNILRDQKPQLSVSSSDKSKASLLHRFRMQYAESLELDYRKILTDPEIALLIKTNPKTLKGVQAIIHYPFNQGEIKSIRAILQSEPVSTITPLFGQ